jgi:tetratricopeptide (TPR) repeat protein
MIYNLCFKALDIEFADAWSNKGLALVNLNRHDEALECFCQVLRIDPSNALAWCTKALILEELQRDNEVEDALAKAEELWSMA